MKLVLCDFDGTITKKDSLADFVQYAIGKPMYYMGLLKLSPILLAYYIGAIPNNTAKEKLITHFFEKWNATDFQKLADEYSLNRLESIIRIKAMNRIRWHQQQGDKIVIISASIECWLKAWCKKNRLDLIATELKINNNKLTGKFSTPNCYGIEKVNRIRESYDLSRYEYIYAYGDSRGDKELFAIADECYYRPFRD